MPNLLDTLESYAPAPKPQPATPHAVEPGDPKVTGFIFKVQANMDPMHRDRIAFMRLVSGTFKRGMKLTPSGHGKPIAIHSPILFFARERELADEAYPGDIIGMVNPGHFHLGDTLCEGKPFRYNGLPQFSPEHFAILSGEP